MRLRLCALMIAACVAAPAPARCDRSTALSGGVGVISRGVGAVDLTVGGAWTFPTPGLRATSISLSGYATGFAVQAVGGLARAHGGGSVDLPLDVRLDLRAGVDLMSYRMCGAVNCGRVSGLAPSAGLALALPVLQGGGVLVNVGMLYTLGSRVFEGPVWNLTIGPYWVLNKDKERGQ